MIEVSLAMLALVALPALVGQGFLLATGLLRERPGLMTLAPAVLVGIGIWSLLSSLAYLGAWSLDWLIAAYALAGGLAWVGGLSRRTSETGKGAGRFGPVILVALLLGALLFFLGSHQDHNSDTMRHLGLVRSILAHPALGDDVFILSRNEPHDLLNAAYVYNSVHVLYAAVSQLTGAEPARVILHLPAIMVLILLAAHAWLASALFNDRRLAIVYVMLIVLVWAFTGFNRWRTLAYPETIAYLGYVAWAGLLVSLIRTEVEKPAWLLFCLVTAGMVYVHSQWWLYCLLTLALTQLFLAARRQWRTAARVLVISLVAGMASLPLLWMRVPFYQPLAAEMGTILRDTFNNQLYQLGPIYGFNPLGRPTSSWSAFTPFWALGAYFAWKAYRGRAALLEAGPGYAAFLALAAYGLMVTPLAMLIAESATTTLAYRLFELVNLWGGLAVFKMAYDRRAGLCAWWDTRSKPNKRLVLAAMGFCGLLYLAIVPAAKIAKAHYQLTWLEPVLLWPVLAALMLGLILAAYLATRLSRVSLGGLGQGLLSRHFTGYFLVLLTMMVLPGSSIAPWQQFSAERGFARKNGPLIDQVLDSPSFRDMLDTLPNGVVVITDQPSLVLAYRSVYVAGSILGLTRQGKRLDKMHERIYEDGTPAEEIYRIALELGADYIIFTPRHSARARDGLAGLPEKFEKIFDSVIAGITHGDARYVVYRIKKNQPSEAVNITPVQVGLAPD